MSKRTMRAHNRQRVRHGVSKADAINLDLHLTQVAVKGIDYLIEWGNGYPSEFGSIEKWHEYLRTIQKYIQIDPDDHIELVEDPDAELDELDKAMGDTVHYRLADDWEPKYKAAANLRDLGRKRLIGIWDHLWD